MIIFKPSFDKTVPPEAKAQMSGRGPYRGTAMTLEEIADRLYDKGLTDRLLTAAEVHREIEKALEHARQVYIKKYGVPIDHDIET